MSNKKQRYTSRPMLLGTSLDNDCLDGWKVWDNKNRVFLTPAQTKRLSVDSFKNETLELH